MKKLILAVLFGIFASCAFASIKTEPTGEYDGDYQIFNIICDTIVEYEERAEYFLSNDTFQIINRFEFSEIDGKEVHILQVIYKDDVCLCEE